MITCWDATQMVVEEASARFAPEWKENPEKKDILKDYCILIGHLANRGKEYVLRHGSRREH